MPLTGYIDISGAFTLTINGVDYTDAVVSIEIEQSLPVIPRADERRPKFEPCIALGQINLIKPYTQTFDWEDVLGTDLKEGRLIEIATPAHDYRFRVSEYNVGEFDPDTGKIISVSLSVTDKLGLINRESQRPPDAEFRAIAIDLGTQVGLVVLYTWPNVIRAVAQFPRKADGNPYVLPSDFDLPAASLVEGGLPNNEPLPTGTFNPAEAIASIAYSRGYLAYCDPYDEKIKVSLYPVLPSTVTPEYRADSREVERFTPQPGTEEPADKVEAVTRGRELRISIRRNAPDLAEVDDQGGSAVDVSAIAVDVWPKSYPLALSGATVLARRTDNQPSISDASSTESYSISARQSYAFPGSPNAGFFNLESGQIERRFHPVYKFAISEITTKQVAKGALAPDLFPEDTTPVTTRLEKYWQVSNVNDGGDGILAREYEQEWLPRSVVFEDDQESDTPIIAREKGYKYQEHTPGQWLKIPYQLVADVDNLSDALIRDPEFSEQVAFVDGIPAAPVAPNEEVEEDTENTDEATAESGDDSEGRVMKVGLVFGNRADSPAIVAQTSLALSQHNRITYDVVRPERPTDTWAPGAREDISDAVLVRVGHRLQIDGEGIRFGFTGLRAAKLAARITVEDLDADALLPGFNPADPYAPLPGQSTPSTTAVTPVFTLLIPPLVGDIGTVSRAVGIGPVLAAIGDIGTESLATFAVPQSLDGDTGFSTATVDDGVVSGDGAIALDGNTAFSTATVDDGAVVQVLVLDGDTGFSTATADDGTLTPVGAAALDGDSGFGAAMVDDGAIAGAGNATLNGNTAFSTATVVDGELINVADSFTEVGSYTGNGTSQSITGFPFAPNVFWPKRNATGDHYVYDTARTLGDGFVFNDAGNPVTGSTVTAFNSDGVTLGNNALVNANGATYYYVSWLEQANDLDIVTYTGNGANRTISHSLGVTPAMILVRRLTNSGAVRGAVYTEDGGAGNRWDLGATFGADATAWNSTAPTSSVFSLGTSAATNANGESYVAYLFGEGVSFLQGTYVGNGSTTGPIVTTGFRPKYVLICSSVTTGVAVSDAHPPGGGEFSLSTAGGALTTVLNTDILTDGFQPRVTANNINQNGSTYYYMAWG